MPGAQPPATRSTLRLTTENQARAPEPVTSTPEDIDAVAIALAGIHALLRELDESLSALQPPRRVSPSQLAALQGRLDQAISAIDDIVKATCRNGRPLLTGNGRIKLTAEPSSPSLQLASLAPNALGERAKSRLCDVRCGGPRDLSRASLADIRKIIAHAAAQVALEQRRFETFVQRPAIISDAAGRVAAENRAAAEQATADLDLVMATSQLTRGHLVAAAQSTPRSR